MRWVEVGEYNGVPHEWLPGTFTRSAAAVSWPWPVRTSGASHGTSSWRRRFASNVRRLASSVERRTGVIWHHSLTY